MRAPLAYFLTWHTYGTWLHGDERGSVDWEHNVPGTPLVEPDAARLRIARARTRHPIVQLDEAARALVEHTIADHCRIRGWDLLEQAARSNHVHIVIGYAGIPPEPMMMQLKSYATRALHRTGHVGPRSPAWVEHGSTRYLNTREQVNAACTYVREGQDVPR